MKQFLLSALLLTHLSGISQKELLIRPYLGMQNGYWDNVTHPSIRYVQVGKNFSELEGDIGVTIEYKINKRFGFNAGIYAGLSAIGYSMHLNTGCEFKSGYAHWEGATYNRFGLGVDYAVSRKVIKKDFDKKKTSLVFAISGGAGINVRANEDLNSGNIGSFYAQDQCGNFATGIRTYSYNINEVTTSLWVRPWIKLYCRGKERIAFSLIFNQGLTKSFNQDITYDYNGSLDTFTNVTKGTTLGFNLSYPIVIKRWKPKAK